MGTKTKTPKLKHDCALLEGLNRICEANSDEYEALCKMLGKKVMVKGQPHTMLSLLRSASGLPLQVETPGGGCNSLLGFC